MTKILIAIVCLLANTCSAHATNQETSAGWYPYSSTKLNVKLLLDLDGAKDVTLNGVLHRGKFEMDESGRQNGVTTYSISIPDPERGLFYEIQIVVRFDDDDGVSAVAGFYSARKLVKDGKHASNLLSSKAFIPIFKRVTIDDLPSTKR